MSIQEEQSTEVGNLDFPTDVANNYSSPTILTPVTCERSTINDSAKEIEEKNEIGGENVVNQDSTPTSPECVATGSSEIGNKRLKSVMWLHFERKKVGEEVKVVCNYCKKVLGGKSRNGTKHLHDHYRICVKRKNRDIRQSILNPVKSVDGKVSLENYSFNPEVAREKLSHMILKHDYPLSMVDDEGFIDYSNSLQPLFKVVTRNTIKNDILGIYDVEKVKAMTRLEVNRSRIAITTDMWTSEIQKKGYMAVTAHYIDDSWTLQSLIMRFMDVPSPHTAEEISSLLLECFYDWNIDRKLSTITVDNAATNDKVIKILLDKLPFDSLILDGKVFHMRCTAHVLNLIVKDGLEAIKAGIDRIRDSVVYWRSTPKRVEKFEETARQLHVPHTKKLVQDVSTRWNSTYLMLSTALLYKSVFSRLKQRDPKFKCCPIDSDWELASEVCDKLKVFYVVTEMLSGTKYPTANMFFPQICKIKLALNEWATSPRVEIKLMASKMTLKFEKYWDVIQGVLALATVLDPRFKMMLIEYYYPKIYGERAHDEIAVVKNVCNDIVKNYQIDANNNDQVSFASTVEGLHQEVDDWMEYETFISSKRTVDNKKSDLDRYLDDDVVPPRTSDFDLLAWWRTNGHKYPTLQVIARDIMAIQMSSVASEAAFSTSGRIVNEYRSKLHPKTLEAVMCTQSWIRKGVTYRSFIEDGDEDEPQVP